MKELLIKYDTIQLDDEDYNRVAEKKWHKTESNHFYSFLSGPRRLGKRSISLQRFVLQYGGELEVAHKDGNPFNFQKENLVPSTHRENMQLCKNNTSGYPGVYMQGKQAKPWCANIWFEGKNRHIGSYLTVEEAIEARKAVEAQVKAGNFI